MNFYDAIHRPHPIFDDAEDLYTYTYYEDLSHLNYVEWTDKYPQHIDEIFADFLSCAMFSLNDKDIKYFVDKGIDLNKEIYYPNYIMTPLSYACELRNPTTIQYLCQNGANPHYVDPDGFTLIDILFLSISRTINMEKDIINMEKCLQTLNNANLIKTVHKWVIDQRCQTYMFSNYFVEFLETCHFIENNYI